MRFDVITIFPDMFRVLSQFSIVQRALAKGIVEINPVDLRDYSLDKHRKVDDYPYGGGAGMLLKPEPLFGAIEAIQAEGTPDQVIFLTPGGVPYSQQLAQELSGCKHIVLVCGHYEGFDQRAVDGLATMELSIGDYVLTGGEIPAMVVVDSVTRLLPGALGNEESALEESFSGGKLEHPQYTRPAVFRGLEVPQVLLSGNHAEITRWRERMALERTNQWRPELLSGTNCIED
jgi:tRNA (guanine37-N1)-methyltransferase